MEALGVSINKKDVIWTSISMAFRVSTMITSRRKSLGSPVTARSRCRRVGAAHISFLSAHRMNSSSKDVFPLLLIADSYVRVRYFRLDTLGRLDRTLT